LSTPTPRGLPTPGGTILAQCDRDQVYIVSWSPAQGYREDGVTRGPAPAASVKFKNGKSEVIVRVTCSAGEPRAVSSTDGS
jgi:serine/threonine-protein kinase